MPEKLYERVVSPIAEGVPVVVPPCPVCRGEQALPTFAVEGLAAQLVVCAGCGLGFLHPQPSAEEIRGFYPPDYYGATGRKFEPMVESLVRFVGARHARFLTRGLPAGARVLDLGCGRGVLLRGLLERGFEAHGLEIDATASEGADPRAEIRHAWHLRAAGYPAAFFDEIVIWHVLEHLAEPRGTIEECRRILKSGGRLVVAVPNFSSLQARWAGAAWFHLDLPRHLFHFPLAALERLLEDCGFACRSRHHFSLRQNPFGWVQSALNRSRRFARNGLYELLQPRSAAALTLGAGERRALRLVYWLGMPPAVALSALAALLRRGATVHVVAQVRD